MNRQEIAHLAYWRRMEEVCPLCRARKDAEDFHIAMSQGRVNSFEP